MRAEHCAAIRVVRVQLKSLPTSGQWSVLALNSSRNGAEPLSDLMDGEKCSRVKSHSIATDRLSEPPRQAIPPEEERASAVAPLGQPGRPTALQRNPTPLAYLPRPVTAFPFAPREAGRTYCAFEPPWLCRAEAFAVLAFAAFFALASLHNDRARTNVSGQPCARNRARVRGRDVARARARQGTVGGAPQLDSARRLVGESAWGSGESHRRALARAVARAAADWSRFFLISSIDAPKTPRDLKVFALRVFFRTRFSPSAPFLCMRRYSYAQAANHTPGQPASQDTASGGARQRTCVHAILRGFHFWWNDEALFALMKLYCCRARAGRRVRMRGGRARRAGPGAAWPCGVPRGAAALWRRRWRSPHLRVDANEELAMARVDFGLAEVAGERLDHHLGPPPVLLPHAVSQTSR